MKSSAVALAGGRPRPVPPAYLPESLTPSNLSNSTL